MYFYEPVARNILAGHGVITSNGTPALRYPPGYPLLLAGIFGLSHLSHIAEETMLAAFILLATGLSAVFIYLLARSVWGVWPALIAPFVWMTYPFALWLTKQPNSETLFLPVFYASIYLFWYALLHKSRAWSLYALAGCLIGLAMLVRPIAIGMGLVLGALLWFAGCNLPRRLRLFLVTMLLLGNLVAILPWEAWVYTTTDRVVTLSGGGSRAVRDGLTFAVVRPSKDYRQIVNVPQDVVALTQDIFVRLDETPSLGHIASVLIEKLQTQPLTVVKLFALKAMRSWYGTDNGRLETPIMLIQTVYFVLILSSSVMLWKRGGIVQRLTLNIWLIVVYFWVMTTLVLSILRYMVPVMGLLFVLVPGAFCQWGILVRRSAEKAA
jgi:4-amino-4-deoxy-L-arabinose transferase-like glycosyltransferase